MHRNRWTGRLTTLAALCLFAGANDPKPDPSIDAQLPSLVSFYRDLHENPELSFQEEETSRKVADALRQTGAKVTTGVGKYGVVGIMKNGEGPTVLVRSDLDALPVAEKTGAPFASKATAKDDAGETVSVMHACGHDIHMTCLVGVARWLAEHKDQWKGTVMFIGQPAEEKIGGAKAMLKDGLYERFGKPDYALALHVAHDLETGKIGYCSGPAMASSASMDIIVKGQGGHGAMPHDTIDPIVMASTLVVDLQSIVSREIKPIDPAVITVGSIHGGTKHNIIPSDVHLQLTLRAFSDDVQKQLIDGIERRAKGLAMAHKAPAPEITIGDSTPPTINTPSLVEQVVPSLKNAVGQENVVVDEPTMGAEDFGLFGQGGVPTFMFRLGTIPAERMARAETDPLPSLHSPFYIPDAEPSIRTGIRAMAAAVAGLLPTKK
jgi:hippurate hydrolase